MIRPATGCCSFCIMFIHLLAIIYMPNTVMGLPVTVENNKEENSLGFPSINKNIDEDVVTDGQCSEIKDLGGYLIEPDRLGQDKIMAFREEDLYPQVKQSDVAKTSILPSFCQFSPLLFWWCEVGMDEFPSQPDITLPPSNNHLNESLCYYLAGDDNYFICQGEDLEQVPAELLPEKLTYLQISSTNISTIQYRDFEGKEIELLSLVDNRIKSIEKFAFAGVSSTRFLNLSNNALQADNWLNNSFFGHFLPLTRLEQLDLSNNNICLEGIDIYQKDTTPILPCLRYINFRNNPLKKLESSIFYGLRDSNLQDLNFQNCELESISTKALRYLTNIQHIDFYNNPKLLMLNANHSPLSAALFYVPSKVFRSLGLGNTDLLAVPWLTNMLVSGTLERLNLANNLLLDLGRFGSGLFPGMRDNLKYLILRRSRIKSIHDDTFKYLKNLEYINLSENLLLSVPKAVRLSSVQHLDLSFQCVVNRCFPSFRGLELDDQSFYGMHNLKKLDLRGIITVLKSQALVSAPSIEELDISSISLTSIEATAFQANVNILRLTCSQCWNLDIVPIEVWLSLRSLEYLDISYSPHSIMSVISTVNSTKDNLGLLLPNLKVLNLTCSLVPDHTLCDSTVYQYESPLDPQLLISMEKIETLHLSKNGLTSWTERRFSGNPKIKHLYLPFNKFKSLTPAMLEDFKQLEYLDFRGLNSVPDGTKDLILCTMQVVSFYNWAEEKIRAGNLTVEGWEGGNGYYCDDDVHHVMKSFKEYAEWHDLIAVPNIHNKFKEGLTWGLGLMGLVLALFVAITYRRRFYITFWLLRQRRRYKTGKEKEHKDPSYLYDVFVSYSQEDHEWVTNQFLTEMEEQDPRVRVCIHQRDFKVGVTVVENIVSAIDRSQKFLLVLSDGFLASDWCQFETHVATHQMIHENRSKDKILIVFKEDVQRRLNKEVQYLVKTRTYLKWPGDKSPIHRQGHFWLKLKQAIVVYKEFRDLQLNKKRLRLKSM